MDRLYFGTGGVPHGSTDPSTLAGMEHLARLKLGAMEIEFVQRVSMGEAAARVVADAAKRLDIKLSAHAPYYINLNSHEPEKVTASQGRLLQAAHIGWLCGAQTVVFHAGFYVGDSPQDTYAVIKKNLETVVNQLRRKGNRIWVRPEVTGKGSQFGTVEEILNLSAELDGVAPAIDFAHWHARNGQNNTYDEFIATLKQVESRLGKAALENMHFHISGIRFSAKGELNHLNLKESDLNYGELMRALKDYGIKGLVICESPNLEADARLMQETYQSL